MSEREQHFSTSDLKIAAAATVLGGRLLRITDDGRRLTFHFQNLPADFPIQVLTGDVQVSVCRFIAAMEQVHALVAQHRRARQTETRP